MPRPIAVWGGLALLVGVLALGGWRLSPVDRGSDVHRDVLVPAGSSSGRIARLLADDGLVRDARAFQAWARLTGRAQSLRAGRYRLSPSYSTPRVIEMLAGGETFPVRVVIPEGLWLTEIAQVIADSLDVTADEVVAAAADRHRLSRFGIPATDPEGYLHPDTYDFEGSESAGDVVERLLEASEQRWTPERAARADSLGLSRHEVLTLASIVEAETRVPSERPLVSAVYHRRLKRGMMLQADPTLLYGRRVRGRGPSREELTDPGPYNTYTSYGLPPGPIGNPGDAAVDAALWPDPDSRALFFVASTDGTHIFTETFDEHVAARRRLRRARSE